MVKKIINSKDIFPMVIFIAMIGLIFWFISKKPSYSFEGNESSSNAALYSTTPQTSTPSVSNSNSGQVRPSEPIGSNEVFSSVPGAPKGNSGPIIPNTMSNSVQPGDLLPKTNNSWGSAGQSVQIPGNLLSPTYLAGIDTINGSLRNPNLQIRSEPPNPITNVSIWNQSTITPDYIRPPLEIDCGSR